TRELRRPDRACLITPSHRFVEGALNLQPAVGGFCLGCIDMTADCAHLRLASGERTVVGVLESVRLGELLPLGLMLLAAEADVRVLSVVLSFRPRVCLSLRYQAVSVLTDRLQTEE